MKRLKGGLILLNLTALSLAFNGEQDDIEDKDVLNQLEELRNFIGAEKNLKPVLVQTRDSDAKVNPIFECSMASYGDDDSFAISGIFTYPDGTIKSLVINVTFEFVDYEGYKIDSATISTSSGITHIKVSNVKNIDGEILSQLKAGDIVVKADATGEHPYIVSFKSATGICLTYADASCIETQSYDYVDGTGWVYNSEDKTTFGGGTKLYRHDLVLATDNYRFAVISDKNISLASAISFTDLGTIISCIGVSHNQYGAQFVTSFKVSNKGGSTNTLQVVYCSISGDTITLVNNGELVISQDEVTEL